jgi:hypothetical protein
MRGYKTMLLIRLANLIEDTVTKQWFLSWLEKGNYLKDEEIVLLLDDLLSKQVVLVGEKYED